MIVQRGHRFEGFTPDGERVLAWARRVLSDCENLRRDARASEANPAGTLRMGVIPASLPLVPPLTQNCLLRYPRMRHEIFTLSATDILRRIGSFETDIGLTYLDDERLGDFRTFPLFRERYVLVARDRSMFDGAASISWADAATLPLCLFTCNMQCRQGIDRSFAAVDVSAEPLIETDSMTALCAHVDSAGLYTILPHSALCLGETSNLSWLPIVPEMHRDVGLVLQRKEPRSALMTSALLSLQAFDLQAWADARAACHAGNSP